MYYFAFKALHIIFAVTWFAALFYIVRLFIYSAEARRLNDELVKTALLAQYSVMKRRLWYGIGWPSAVVNIACGLSMLSHLPVLAKWILYKLAAITLICIYHLSCQAIYRDQVNGTFKYSPFLLRIWNELATVLLFLAVFIAVFKDYIQLKYLVIGIFVLSVSLLLGIMLARQKLSRDG